MRLRAFYDNSVFLIYTEIRGIKNSFLLNFFFYEVKLKTLTKWISNYCFFLKSPFSNQWSNICFVKFLHPLIIQFTFFWQISIHALKIIPQSQVLVNFWPYLFIPFDIIYECIHRSWWKYGTELLNFLNVMCLVSNHIFSHQGAM